MSLVNKANSIINNRSEEKERQYGPMTEGMKAATRISEFINSASTERDELDSFRYLYGLKLSRQKYNHKEDNLLDAIAYRMAEINALLEKDESFNISIETFDSYYKFATDNYSINFVEQCFIISQLTTLKLEPQDIYKIHLGLEICNERKAILEKNDTARIHSILKQIYIMNEMNQEMNKETNDEIKVETNDEIPVDTNNAINDEKNS